MSQMEFDIPKKIKKPRKSYFLGCFGLSMIEKESLHVNKSTSVKRKNKFKSKKLLFFSKIIRKHSSSSSKTIPVDVSDNNIDVVKSEKVKTPVIAGDVTKGEKVKGQSQTKIVVHDKVDNKTKDHKTKDNIHENNKSLDQLLDKVHDNSTCRNEFSRSVTISSTHNLSQNLINSTKDKHEIKLSHSTSLPPPKGWKKLVAETAIRKVNNEKSDQRHVHVSNNDNFDSIIGMSILMVTLLIMLFWGKACAIVCTCAWFYFIPRFRHEKEEMDAGKIGGGAGDDIDMDSEEYKRKVVLDGLLKRNHRNGVGVL
ncbi:hypothetical protein P3S68_031009 [Capsicum galapagoense]